MIDNNSMIGPVPSIGPLFPLWLVLFFYSMIAQFYELGKLINIHLWYKEIISSFEILEIPLLNNDFILQVCCFLSCDCCLHQNSDSRWSLGGKTKTEGRKKGIKISMLNPDAFTLHTCIGLGILRGIMTT